MYIMVAHVVFFIFRSPKPKLTRYCPRLGRLNITLSSNARRVPFEYLQIYLNKRGKICKARVNDDYSNIEASKRYQEVSNVGVGIFFQKVQLHFRPHLLSHCFKAIYICLYRNLA